jgi:putative aldouronate transport system substrate-binding protein
MVLPPLKGVHGQSYAGYALYDGSTSMVITDKCKNPELAIALYDYLLDPYIVISSDYGEQGVGWDMPDAGQLSYLGTTPVFKLISNAQIPLNTTWNYGNMYGYLKDVRYGEQANDFATVQKFYDTWDASLVDRVANNPSYYTEYYVVGFAPHEGKYPPISMYVLNSAKSDADSNRINDINATLNTYRDQTVTEFIMGTRNISSDAEWNAYLTQLNQLGAAELVSIYQKYIK